MKNRKRIFSVPKKYRSRLILRGFLSVYVIVVALIRFVRADYYSVFLCALTLALFDIPAFVNKNLKVELPGPLEVIILLFIFAAEILGEIGSFYTYLPWWDTMLHTINGFLMGAIGLSLFDILNKNPRIKINMSPLFVVLVSFCFSMTVGVVWEFFEYNADVVFKTDMQKDYIVNQISSVALNPYGVNEPVKITGITDTVLHCEKGGTETEYVIEGGYLDIGLIDTMKDLTVNCAGAALFSAGGYLYLIGRGKGNWLKWFVPLKKQENTE